ncbi:hypothetical protein [Rhodopirellula sp. P2]|nr:hypothetical protein [Rhodopirellula sp. P2]WDQ16412.1 hypothetical protein PSR62_22720 [Rhodopirellula sp. P2]
MTLALANQTDRPNATLAAQRVPAAGLAWNRTLAWLNQHLKA